MSARSTLRALVTSPPSWHATGAICSSSTALSTADAPAAEPEASQKRVGRFRRLRESLRKTRQALQTEIQATLFEELNEETWERLEEALIYADVGAQTTAKVVAQLEQEADENKLTRRPGAVGPADRAADRDRPDRR